MILSSGQITGYLLYKANILASLEHNLHLKSIHFLPETGVEISQSSKNSQLFRL